MSSNTRNDLDRAEPTQDDEFEFVIALPKITITAANFEEVCENLTWSVREQVEIGSVVWRVPVNNYSLYFVVSPEKTSAAMIIDGDVNWGDYDEDEETITIEAGDRCIVYDEYGDEIESDD